MNKIDLKLFSYIKRLPTATAQGKYPYSFINRQGKNLVVVIGDSWTWAADVSLTDDKEERLKKSFGGIISQELSADYLNLGQCGSCNLHIIERVKELNNINFDYDSVYVICTFTEVGRSLNGPYDRNIDYVNWFANHKINEFLEFHNSIGVDQLSILNKKVKLILGCNFVDPIGIETTLKKTWLECYNEQVIKNEYTKPCYLTSPWVIEKIRPFIEEFNPNVDKTILLNWIVELINAATIRNQLMSDQKYFAGVNHPNAEGHKIWANYILENIHD